MGSYCNRHNIKLTGLCLWCGKEVCSECIALARGKKYCNECIAKIRVVDPDSSLGSVTVVDKSSVPENKDDSLNIEIIN